MNCFQLEQGESLKKKGVKVEYFNIVGRGLVGYIKSIFVLKKILKKEDYDIIHAHYGLSGMISVCQRKIPVIITFHGSDIWYFRNRMISRIASYLSAGNIFISKTLQDKARCFRKKRSYIIPCGVDLNKSFPMEKEKARKMLGWNNTDKYILFTSSFNNPIKNYPLAKKAADQIDGAKLIELHGYEQEQVNILMNACDVLLITSFYESGPLVAKEAMACNLPIVSTDVGDVGEVIRETKGCFIVDHNALNIAGRLKHILRDPKRTKGRDKITEFDVTVIAEKIVLSYFQIL